MDTFFSGEIVTELVKVLASVARNAYACRDIAEKLRRDVEQIMPILAEIRRSGSELPQGMQRQLGDLQKHLEEGLDVALKASRARRWNVYGNNKLARRMKGISGQVERWLSKQGQMQILYVSHRIWVDQSRGFDRIDGRSSAACSAAPWPPAASAARAAIGDDAMGAVVAGLGGMGLGEEEEVMDVAAARIGREAVKKMLIEDAAGEVVGICGIGGSGKTTLAKELCRDPDVKSHFGNRVFFQTVSQSPDLCRLKQELRMATAPPPPAAGNKYEDPFLQWPAARTLVVLDDVWSEVDLEELIPRRAPGCKTLVVSRFRFQAVPESSTLELELLREEEALRLFCLSAFGRQSIPPFADKELVMQVIAECRGLPLALKVIGASLRGQQHRPKIWKNARDKLSLGEAISESHEAKLLKRMAVGIDRLQGKAAGECFLDLGSFPEDKRIPMDLLIALWMELHDLTEEAAYSVLVELSDKHLLTLVKDAQNRAGDEYSNYCELSVTQHDVLRDLALYLSNGGCANQRKRLIMAKKEREGGLPKEWERGSHMPFDARIVSIHSGEMNESDWFEMRFPEAEALILSFSSASYYLPPFIGNMPKLKALILINHGGSCTVLRNLSVFASLRNLKSVWFEKIAVPPLPETTPPLRNLAKISFVLCQLDESLRGFLVDLPRTCPRLSDLTVDHCADLTELPPRVSEIGTLQSLTVSNCHELRELPSDLGELTALRVLRVYACPSLDELPESVGGLRNLEYIDISQCIGLRRLPEGVGRLSRLRKIDMRGCPHLRSLPRSPASSLVSLRCVVCGEEAELLWKEAMESARDFRVQVEEDYYDMDWFE